MAISPGFLETRDNQGSTICAPSDAADAKRRQNLAFKRFGSIAWIFGVGGFLPTTLLGLYHGVAWSAAKLQPHSDSDAWLYVHAFSMWLWCFAVAVQLWTGGQPREPLKRVHRYVGYIGFAALTTGMLCGGIVYTVKWDFFVHGQVAAGYYTVVISIFAWVNMAIAVAHARHRRTAEHKDFVLMAFMWTMDPAVQRAFMHLLRLCLFQPEPEALLAVGKLCGNVFLVLVFGCAAIVGNRENVVTVVNVAGQWTFGLMYTAAIMKGMSGKAGIDSRDFRILAVVTSASGIVLIVLGAVHLWFKAGKLRRWRPSTQQGFAFVAWFFMVWGFMVALLVPQGPAT